MTMSVMETTPAAQQQQQQQQHVILVDRNDVELATQEKLLAHQAGALHRAVSVFVFAPDGSLFLQRRAAGKYHSGGLWSNTACTHPRPGESNAEAARRCIEGEMGISCPLEETFSFTYYADLGNGLSEHEYDHVFVGWFAGTPSPDPSEVAEWRRVGTRHLEHELREHPTAFTPWFRLAWQRIWTLGGK
jgi:isopentenyl-diphosphate Delta-isomerase